MTFSVRIFPLGSLYYVYNIFICLLFFNDAEIPRFDLLKKVGLGVWCSLVMAKRHLPDVLRNIGDFFSIRSLSKRSIGFRLCKIMEVQLVCDYRNFACTQYWRSMQPDNLRTDVISDVGGNLCPTATGLLFSFS